ncbi:MAG: 4Fe-4S binding protein [bacterium]
MELNGKKIGVFICHCGTNIAGTLDVKRIVESVKDYPGVAQCVDYVYMCSEPGQKMIKDAIRDKNLEGIVIASCSPTLHQATFRKTISSAGLNPYQCEIANIREQCSWVHMNDKERATQKAIGIIRSIIEKLRLDESLLPVSVHMTKRALVIGGGIAGIQSALDIANSGYEVVLVEKQSSIGGHMAQLSETFPTLDCSQCILTPRMVEAGQHPGIKLLTYSEVEEISGYVGNFRVRIKRKPTFVDWNKCTACGLCSEKCPTKVPSEFDRGLKTRKAIYVPFPQAVPNKPVIDSENCLYLKTGKCKLCEKTCQAGAINFKDEVSYIEEDVGAVVVATGYELYGMENLPEYGMGKYADITDGLAFERLLSASGPTAGEVRRPSDGKVPKRVVFVACVGSRDREHHFPYCSKICCMYTAKHAMLYKHKVPDGEAIVFFIDTRAGGKNYEEFMERAQEEDEVIYIRGKVSRVLKNDDGKLTVLGADTVLGKQIKVECDMVVLSMAIVPSPGIKELGRKLKIQTDAYGFLSEAHPKLRPVETLTAGFYLAGCAQAPKDIPDVVAQASGAASKVFTLFSREELSHEPIVPYIDDEVCSGCGRCIKACAYEAIELDTKRKVARVNEVVCEGCGACACACPNGACQLRNLTSTQVFNIIDALEG